MSFGKFTRQEIIDLISGSWSPYWGGTGGTPGGPLNSIQFNSASIFSGSSTFTYNTNTNGLYYTGSFFISGAISASFGANTIGFFGTASWAVSASSAITSSFAVSASYAFSSSHSTTASYVTTLRAADPDKSIQFNSNGLLSGSSNFTFDSSSNKLALTGSANIVITGSEAGLQIFGVGGLQSILSASYIVGTTDRYMTSLFVPSGSYGQIWNLVYGPRPTHIYEITSSNGDMRFKGRIGNANINNPYDTSVSIQYGRLGGNGIYAANLNKVLIPQGTFSGNGTGKLIVYDPDTIDSQPTGFTASIDSPYELGLMAYTCSYRVGNTGEGISPNELVIFLSNNPIIYTPSASVDYYTVFGRCTGSNGDASNPLVPSPLSASIAALSASNQPISGAANLYPVGFFMSTFESGTPVSESFVNLTPDLTGSFGIPLNKIFSGSFNGSTFIFGGGAQTTQGTYNNDLKKLYTFISLPNNGGIPAIAEIDFNQSPPKLIAVNTGSNANAAWTITYNSTTKSVILRNGFQFLIFDASSSPVNWASPVATFTPANAHYYTTNALAVSNSFYAFGYSAITDLLSVTKITSGSSGYTIQSQSYAQSYANGAVSYGVSNPSFASSSNISKLITLDRSDIGLIGYSAIGGTNENLTTTFARAGYVYAIDTGSLTTSSFYTPYGITDTNGPNNLVEFRSSTGSLLSYVDPDGKFIGTSSWADYYINSSLAIYSGSSTPILMSPSASSIWFKGDNVTSSINGNSITMSFGSSGGGGSSTPGGANTTIQFNSSGVFSGSSNFTFNSSSNSVSLTGSLLISASSAIAPLIITATTTPPAVAGGIYFDGTDFYLGFT